MMPPLTKGPDGAVNLRLAIKAPMTEWLQVGAFDTAEECERARPGVLATLKAGDWATIFKGARCVPAEHIYPPKAPGVGR